MTVFPLYLLIVLILANRYFVGLFLSKVKGRPDPTMPEQSLPSVTVVIPIYNEGRGIYDTIQSLLAQTYPADRLTITVVDDCSTDDSYEWAMKARAGSERVTVLRNPHNIGKRLGIAKAVRLATSELIVSVDSDVLVHPDAIRQLALRFTHEKIAAVGGRVHVSNANENWLTRMQAIKYYFGYEYLKNLERSFQTVLCLSGCLTAYRRHVLLELEPILAKRNVLGVPIKYGEDRFLTRQILKHGYKTVLTLDAECATVAPNTLAKYFSQQLRWRRSNLVDLLGGLSHVWKLHPVVALHYYSLGALLVAYPTVVSQNVLDGTFWHLGLFHSVVLGAMGVIYWVETRGYPSESRVHPLWFLPMAVLMPVTYMLITPLAIFTLDSSSWETRGHRPTEPKPVPAAPEASEALLAPAAPKLALEGGRALKQVEA